MSVSAAKKELKELLSELFDGNVWIEWSSRHGAQDWLKIGDDIYAPRPDIAVGPFNIEEGVYVSEIKSTFDRYRTCFDELEIENADLNKNPRCLIAIEIENSNKGKHMLGNIINASLLGKVGMVVTLRDEFYNEAERIHRYLKGAFKRKKIGHDPSNVVIKDFSELKRILQERCLEERSDAG